MINRINCYTLIPQLPQLPETLFISPSDAQYHNGQRW